MLKFIKNIIIRAVVAIKVYWNGFNALKKQALTPPSPNDTDATQKYKDSVKKLLTDTNLKQYKEYNYISTQEIAQILDDSYSLFTAEELNTIFTNIGTYIEESENFEQLCPKIQTQCSLLKDTASTLINPSLSLNRTLQLILSTNLIHILQKKQLVDSKDLAIFYIFYPALKNIEQYALAYPDLMIKHLQNKAFRANLSSENWASLSSSIKTTFQVTPLPILLDDPLLNDLLVNKVFNSEIIVSSLCSCWEQFKKEALPGTSNEHTYYPYITSTNSLGQSILKGKLLDCVIDQLNSNHTNTAKILRNKEMVAEISTIDKIGTPFKTGKDIIVSALGKYWRQFNEQDTILILNNTKEFIYLYIIHNQNNDQSIFSSGIKWTDFSLIIKKLFFSDTFPFVNMLLKHDSLVETLAANKILTAESVPLLCSCWGELGNPIIPEESNFFNFILSMLNYNLSTASHILLTKALVDLLARSRSNSIATAVFKHFQNFEENSYTIIKTIFINTDKYITPLFEHQSVSVISAVLRSRLGLLLVSSTSVVPTYIFYRMFKVWDDPTSNEDIILIAANLEKYLEKTISDNSDASSYLFEFLKVENTANFNPYKMNIVLRSCLVHILYQANKMDQNTIKEEFFNQLSSPPKEEILIQMVNNISKFFNNSNVKKLENKLTIKIILQSNLVDQFIRWNYWTSYQVAEILLNNWSRFTTELESDRVVTNITRHLTISNLLGNQNNAKLLLGSRSLCKILIKKKIIQSPDLIQALLNNYPHLNDNELKSIYDNLLFISGNDEFILKIINNAPLTERLILLEKFSINTIIHKLLSLPELLLPEVVQIQKLIIDQFLLSSEVALKIIQHPLIKRLNGLSTYQLINPLLNHYKTPLPSSNIFDLFFSPQENINLTFVKELLSKSSFFNSLTISELPTVLINPLCHKLIENKIITLQELIDILLTSEELFLDIGIVHNLQKELLSALENTEYSIKILTNTKLINILINHNILSFPQVIQKFYNNSTISSLPDKKKQEILLFVFSSSTPYFLDTPLEDKVIIILVKLLLGPLNTSMATEILNNIKKRRPVTLLNDLELTRSLINQNILSLPEIINTLEKTLSSFSNTTKQNILLLLQDYTTSNKKGIENLKKTEIIALTNVLVALKDFNASAIKKALENIKEFIESVCTDLPKETKDKLIELEILKPDKPSVAALPISQKVEEASLSNTTCPNVEAKWVEHPLYLDHSPFS